MEEEAAEEEEKDRRRRRPGRQRWWEAWTSDGRAYRHWAQSLARHVPGALTLERANPFRNTARERELGARHGRGGLAPAPRLKSMSKHTFSHRLGWPRSGTHALPEAPPATVHGTRSQQTVTAHGRSTRSRIDGLTAALALPEVPDLDGLVRRPGGQLGAVRRARHREHPRRVPGDRAHVPGLPGVEDLYRAVVAGLRHGHHEQLPPGCASERARPAGCDQSRVVKAHRRYNNGVRPHSARRGRRTCTAGCDTGFACSRGHRAAMGPRVRCCCSGSARFE